jgi:hypothetical protein
VGPRRLAAKAPSSRHVFRIDRFLSAMTSAAIPAKTAPITSCRRPPWARADSAIFSVPGSASDCSARPASHILIKSSGDEGCSGPPLQVVGWSGRHPHGRCEIRGFRFGRLCSRTVGTFVAVVVCRRHAPMSRRPEQDERCHAHDIHLARASRESRRSRSTSIAWPARLSLGRVAAPEETCCSRLLSACLSHG